MDALDIARAEGLALKQRGGSWWGCCPFHAEKTPSFRINHGLWYCFGCGSGGDALALYQRLHGLDRAEAAAALAGMTWLPQRPREHAPPPRPRFLDRPDPDGFTWDRLCRIRNQAVEVLEAFTRNGAEITGPGGEAALWEAVAVREETEHRLDELLTEAVEEHTAAG
jgi:DNA primase